MKAKDKVLEITDGNYHYKSKRTEELLSKEMTNYRTWEWNGKVSHLIQVDSTITRHGGKFKEVLEVSYTNSGANKGSWRVAVTYGRF